MSIFIPVVKIPDSSLRERQWLRRVRGSTLATIADSANQSVFRNGLAMHQKSFVRGFDRGDKEDGAGHVNQNISLFSDTALKTHRMEILDRHPGAESLALILTYLAPNDIIADIDPNSATQTKSKIEIRLLAGSTTRDPGTGSGYAIELSESNGTLPSNRVLRTRNRPNLIEYLAANGFLALGENGETSNFGDEYSARFVRTICAADPGSATTTRPRRLTYGNLTSTERSVTIEFRTRCAVLIDVLAFEIPRILI